MTLVQKLVLKKVLNDSNSNCDLLCHTTYEVTKNISMLVNIMTRVNFDLLKSLEKHKENCTYLISERDVHKMY